MVLRAYRCRRSLPCLSPAQWPPHRTQTPRLVSISGLHVRLGMPLLLCRCRQIMWRLKRGGPRVPMAFSLVPTMLLMTPRRMVSLSLSLALSRSRSRSLSLSLSLSHRNITLTSPSTQLLNARENVKETPRDHASLLRYVLPIDILGIG